MPLASANGVATRSDPFTLAEDVLPLGHLLLRSARRAPGKEAVVFGDQRWTYADLADRALGVARSLLGLGMDAGDHVGILMTNQPDLIAAIFGASLAGAIVVPVNARYRASELGFVMRDADIQVLLTHDRADAHVDFTELLYAAIPGLTDAADPLALDVPDHRALKSVVMMGDRQPNAFVTRSRFDEVGDAVDAQAFETRAEGARLRDLALILYTSGTTSQPRGAMLSHEAFVRAFVNGGRAFGTSADDRHFTPLPLFHVTGIGCLSWVIGRGATFFSDYHFDAGRSLETLERERITEFYPAYQAVMEAVVNHERFAHTDLSSLRVFLNVAPPEVLKRFQSHIPHAVQLTTYGGTEGGQVTLTRFSDSLDARLTTCGRPQPGMEVRVVGDDGRQLARNAVGVIEFRGPNTFSGYYNDLQKTAETVLDGGWVNLGDRGSLDDSGYLRFLGRVKETLKVGGENVAPQEIEEQLCTHPAVKLAQVVGIPDARLSEVPAAFIELVPGRDVDEGVLLDYCASLMASFKVPRLIRFIDESDWPMSATKIQRSKLRERLMLELETETD